MLVGYKVNQAEKQKLEQEQSQVQKQEQKRLENDKAKREIEFKNNFSSFLEAAALQAQLDMMNSYNGELEKCYVFSEETETDENSLKKRWDGPDTYEGSVHVIAKNGDNNVYLEGWLKNDEFYVEKQQYKNVEVKELTNNPKFNSVDCKNASSYEEMKKVYEKNNNTIVQMTP